MEFNQSRQNNRDLLARIQTHTTSNKLQHPYLARSANNSRESSPVDKQMLKTISLKKLTNIQDYFNKEKINSLIGANQTQQNGPQDNNPQKKKNQLIIRMKVENLKYDNLNKGCFELADLNMDMIKREKKQKQIQSENQQSNQHQPQLLIKDKMKQQTSKKIQNKYQKIHKQNLLLNINEKEINKPKLRNNPIQLYLDKIQLISNLKKDKLENYTRKKQNSPEVFQKVNISNLQQNQVNQLRKSCDQIVNDNRDIWQANLSKKQTFKQKPIKIYQQNQSTIQIKKQDIMQSKHNIPNMNIDLLKLQKGPQRYLEQDRQEFDAFNFEIPKNGQQWQKLNQQSLPATPKKKNKQKSQADTPFIQYKNKKKLQTQMGNSSNNLQDQITNMGHPFKLKIRKPINIQNQNKQQTYQIEELQVRSYKQPFSQSQNATFILDIQEDNQASNKLEYTSVDESNFTPRFNFISKQKQVFELQEQSSPFESEFIKEETQKNQKFRKATFRQLQRVCLNKFILLKIIFLPWA